MVFWHHDLPEEEWNSDYVQPLDVDPPEYDYIEKKPGVQRTRAEWLAIGAGALTALIIFICVVVLVNG